MNKEENMRMVYYFSGLGFGISFSMFTPDSLSFYAVVATLILTLTFLINYFLNYGDNS
jgi:hypothetical protein